MVVDTGGVIPLSKSKFEVMEELAITTTIGMEGIPLATREAAIARMPSMIERQATAAVEEASAIIFLVDGQTLYDCEDIIGQQEAGSADTMDCVVAASLNQRRVHRLNV
ncbi:hypothetical protein LINGRAHAP2_LOCUS18187 [Linum grandiflorum]